MVKSFRGRSLASSVRASQEDSAPELVPETDFFAKVVESRGKGQFLVSLPTSTTLLVYMPPKFRNALWIRRGSFVIIRRYETSDAELLHVLSSDQVKEIKRTSSLWPKEFTEAEVQLQVSESDSDSNRDTDYDNDNESDSNSHNESQEYE